MAKHASDHEHTAATTPVLDVATEAQLVLVTAERLGNRITDHLPGCYDSGGGPCTCGSADFLAACSGLADALGVSFSPS